MQPRLIKLAISKSTLADRNRVWSWLTNSGKDALLPKERGTADAMRVAISYTLRDWTNWKGEDGTVYRAIAASPTEQKGLCLDINVQIRKPDGVQYSERICRLTAEEGKEPVAEAKNVSGVFFPLWKALDVSKLLDLGRDHLFDSDLRNIAEGLLSGSIDKLWPGMWLCLTEAPALEEVAILGTMIVAGELQVKVLTLEQSAANRSMLAEELAKEYVSQLERLTKRLSLPKPMLEAIEREYMGLCTRIKQAEEMLGTPVPCLTEQVAFEEALAQTPA